MYLKKIKFFLFSLCLFFLGFGAVSAADDYVFLECNYDGTKNITVLDSSVSSAPTYVEKSVDEVYKIEMKFVRKAGNGNLDMNLKVIETSTNDKKTGSLSLISNFDQSVTNDKKFTLNAIGPDIKQTYSCPQYVYVKDNGRGVVASNNLDDLYTYATGFTSGIVNKTTDKLNDDFYILTLNSQKRNSEDVCFYHTESEVLNKGYLRTSVYFIRSLNIYYTINDGKYTRSEFEIDKGSPCPVGFYIDSDNDGYSIPYEDNNGINSNLIIYRYKETENGSLVVDESMFESLKQQLVNSTNTLIEGYEIFKSSCLDRDLSRSNYQNCIAQRTGITPYINAYNGANNLIDYAITAGLDENSDEIKNLKSAMKNYSDYVLNSSISSFKTVQHFYCEYDSNVDDKYLVVSSDCTSTDKSCAYKFTIYDNKNNLNVIDSFSLNKVDTYINETCLALKSTNIFDSIQDSNKCYETINYDYVDGKIQFMNYSMLLNDSWSKKFILSGVRQDFNASSTSVFDAEILTDFSAYKIINDGFAIKTDDECSVYGSMIYNNDPLECSDFFDSETIEFINKAYFYIEIIAALVIIALSVKDYALAILSSDSDAMKKNNANLFKRLGLFVVILILPGLIKLVINLFNVEGFNSNDPLCGAIKTSRKIKEESE